jgi:hypothetical protein
LTAANAESRPVPTFFINEGCKLPIGLSGDEQIGDLELPHSRSVTNPGVPPHLSMNLSIAGDDFILERMFLIAKDESSVYDNVPNGRPIEREDDDRQQVFCGMTGDRDVI